MNTVLVVAAHPDDELLGLGGTLARHAQTGDAVHAVVLSDGASSRYPDDMINALDKYAHEAAGVLGLDSVQLYRFPDQMLDTVPLLQLTRAVEQFVDDLAPTIVYTHFAGDVNADHTQVADATWTACRPYVAPRLRRFAVYETPSSTEWARPEPGRAFLPNLFVDVSDTVAIKLRAMACYVSELRDYPHPRSLRALEERAAYWGSRVGVRAAEAFQVLREVER